ncbi:thioredoxin domain-containing protein [Streptomyces sp. NPDC051976]|uniref:DsbA family protein n=1 Tax=Streptomyces sp. NPDC051976 TaxID=3154947 RepID=UPI0034322355
MTESKGPEQDRTAGPGGKKRKTPLDRIRPYAMGLVAMAVVFGGSALIGQHVRSGKEDKVKAPSGVVGAPVVPTGPVVTDTPTTGPTPTPSPTGPTLGFPVRPSIPVSVTIYEDLRSPDSKAFADEYDPTLTQLLTTGQVQLQYRLVTASDKQYGGSGAKVAANAAACAQDQARFPQFVYQLWKMQPDPQKDSLNSVALMKELAKKAGKIKMGTFEPCVKLGDHDGWVNQGQQVYEKSGLGGVPVVEINGVQVKDVHSTLTPQKLRAMVLKEAKRVIAVQATPSSTPALAG